GSQHLCSPAPPQSERSGGLPGRTICEHRAHRPAHGLGPRNAVTPTQRINVVSVEMPPLRDRKDDIPALSDFFIKRFSSELKKRVDHIHSYALKIMMRHH